MTHKTDLTSDQNFSARLDLTQYHGEPGQPIAIRTRSGLVDHRVGIIIRDVLGTVLEEGPADWSKPDACWIYTAKAHVGANEIWMLSLIVAGPQGTTTTRIIAVPLRLHLASDFDSAAWAVASGLGRWKNN